MCGTYHSALGGGLHADVQGLEATQRHVGIEGRGHRTHAVLDEPVAPVTATVSIWTEIAV